MSERQFIPKTFHGKIFIRTVIAAAVLVFILPQPSPTVAQEAAASSRKLVSRTEPVYPQLALKNGLHGVVRLRVVIGADGRAKSTEVLGGNPIFVDTAAESVKKWKWAAGDHETTEVVEVAFTTKS